MSTKVSEISPADLKRRLEAGERLMLLDVREPVERGINAIPAPAETIDLHIPMGQIVENLETLQVHVAQASAPVVVYCHHGVRSMAVAQWLSVQGIPGILNLTGGIDAYSLGADPTVPRYR